MELKWNLQLLFGGQQLLAEHDITAQWISSHNIRRTVGRTQLVHAGADTVHISKHGTCWITWTHDMCQDDTGGVSGGYRSVKHQCGSGSAVMRGMSHTGTRGHVMADDNDAWVRMSGHMNSMVRVTDVGGGLLGCRNMWRWRNLDVSSARCNTPHLSCTPFRPSTGRWKSGWP